MKPMFGRRAMPLALLGCLLAGGAGALPRFALRSGASCSLCHVNPTGGGMRNSYGRNVYGAQRLPLYRDRAGLADLPVLDGEVGHGIAVGADARFVHIYGDSQNKVIPFSRRPPTMDTLFLMQADAYGTAEISERLAFYLDLGALGSFETFGLLRAPFARGYLKVGKFVPGVGLKLDSHTAYTRETFGLGPRSKDTGIEIGIEPGSFVLQLGLLNGAEETSQLDSDLGKAVTGKAEYWLNHSKVKLFAGGSVLYNSRTESQGQAVSYLRAGGHGGVSLGRVGLLGEIAYHLKDNRTALEQVPRYAAYSELSALVTRGVDVSLTYEFLDPEMRIRNNGSHRVGATVELYPWRGSELRVMYRYTIGKPSFNDLARYHEAVTMLHFYL